MKKRILTLLLTSTFAFSNVMFVNAEEPTDLEPAVVEEVVEETKEVQTSETPAVESPVEEKTVVEEVPSPSKEVTEEVSNPSKEEVVVEEVKEPVQTEEIKTEEIKEEEITKVPANENAPVNVEEKKEEALTVEEEKEETPVVEEKKEETPTVEEKEEIDVNSLIGLSESEIPVETINDENTIVKYVITDEAEPGTVIGVEEGDNLTLQIASEELIAESKTSKFNLLSSFDLFDEMTDEPSIEDGSWDDYPVSYEYNWDNSQSAWNWGEWRDGVKYTTEQGTYDNNVRHAMGMYSDGENIHLHISYATIYQSIANGDDFNFYIDGQGAKVRVLYADNGSGITGQRRDEGKYDLVVVNGDHWNSGYEANGSYGTMVVKDGNINNEMEIVIPLSTLKEQNSAINTDNIQNIEFFTPNLMYRRISCGGASSGPQGFIIISGIVFCVPLVFRKKFESLYENLKA